MKKSMIALTAAALFALSGCVSVESTTVGSNEVVATGGEPVAVIQSTTLGWTAIFHLIQIVQGDLDQTINRVLVGEAKTMGATKIELKSVSTTPRKGIFALLGIPAPIPFLLNFTMTQGVAIAVK